MKFKIVFATLLFPLLAACSHSSSSSLSKAKAAGAASEDSECITKGALLESVGLDVVKAGLDETVTQIPSNLINDLIQGTRIYRRGDPSPFTQKEINQGVKNAIKALNQIGKIFESNGLVAKAPVLDIKSGTFMAQSMSYPVPLPGRDNPKLSTRDEFDGVAGFGIVAGESAASAGFSIFGEVNTKINTVNYDVKLKYTAVTNSYILETRAYTDDLKSVPFTVDNCQSDAEFQGWTKLPMEQIYFQNVTGVYGGPLDGGDGILNLKQIDDNTVSLSLSVASSQCAGAIEGQAVRSGDKIILTAKPDSDSDLYSDLCTLTLTLSKEGITSDEKSCLYFHGHACSFDSYKGIFKKLTP